MKIEHFAFQVENPATVADWYCKNLDFTVKRAIDSPVPTRFLADESGDVMIEIYQHPIDTPDYASMNPLTLHMAFVCDDIEGTIKRLTSAGATLASGPDHLPSGDILCILRDPFGLAIQLCYRKTPMI